MRVNYQVNATPQFRVLSDDQIEEIFHSTLDVLERAGTRVSSAAYTTPTSKPMKSQIPLFVVVFIVYPSKSACCGLMCRLFDLKRFI